MCVPRFALMGAAGYIAPRHMEAIRDVGGVLTAVFDPHDSVGILDQYFPSARYFREFERFDRYLSRFSPDYIVICTPNYLHDAHIRYAVKSGCQVICEKPVAINPNTCGELTHLDGVWTIMQLRYHAEIEELKDRIDRNVKHTVNVDYVTPRGAWYDYSWKGDQSKSGGILMNIGIHMFDMLLWVFGDDYDILYKDIGNRTARGELQIGNTYVDWRLSLCEDDLPDAMPTYRSIVVDNYPVDFTNGFKNLHAKSYSEILEGRGWTPMDAMPAIELIHDLNGC